jgi:hypothetical protein
VNSKSKSGSEISIVTRSSDLLRKRAVLLSARLQFSPETQPIRETAIDGCIQRVLIPFEDGLSVRELLEFISFTIGIKNSAITALDVRVSLARLQKQKDVVISHDSAEPRYRLASETRDRVSVSEEDAEKMIRVVFTKLFAGEDFLTSDYSRAFLDFLSRVFSTLAETYVRLLRSQTRAESMLSSPLFTRALRKTLARFAIDEQAFTAAATRFFREPDPDFAALQWNFAQGHYVAKCLGLDESGALLSAEMLQGATLYLDTNVALHGLSPRSGNKAAFENLSRACSSHGIDLKVSQVTLNELRGVVESSKRDLPRIASKIPAETTSKVRNIFIEDWRSQSLGGEPFDFAEVFKPFETPLESLGSFGIGCVDDRWFDEAEFDEETIKLVDELIKRTMTRRSGPKSPSVARHDALMLRWVQLERQTGNQNAWFVTLDRTLPFAATGRGQRPLAVTLDALLHWVSPVTLDAGNDDIAHFYSQALRYQILPRDNFFDATDFKLFVDMEFDSRSMPAEDVENCLRSLKSQFGTLDPSDSRQREQLARLFARFWADPGRKYADNIAFLEENISSLEQTLATNEQQRARDFEAKSQEIERLVSELNPLKREKEKRDRIKVLCKSVAQQLCAVLIFGASCLVSIYLSAKFGQGSNLWQKIGNSGSLSLLPVSIGVVLAKLMSGRSWTGRLIARVNTG